MTKYKCSVCGYIYDEIKTNKAFNDLPNDWRCPICKALKDKFVKISDDVTNEETLMPHVEGGQYYIALPMKI